MVHHVALGRLSSRTLAVGVTWLIVGLSLIVLPLAVAVYAYVHLWKQALELFAAWLVLFTLCRVLRLGSLWEDPPSFL